MECMDSPITAAVLPNPAATANIRTQRIAGTARMKATMALTTFVTLLGARFRAPSRPRNSAIAPLNRVVRTARPIVVSSSMNPSATERRCECG